METETEQTTLANLAKGAAMELFEIELEKVLENIADVNRDPKKPRELNILIKFTPTESPNIILVDVGIKPKLSAFNSIKTHISFGRNENTRRMEAHEIQRSQRQFWDDEKESGNVRPIRPRSE